jgi:molybdate transport system ATP-binding protein
MLSFELAYARGDFALDVRAKLAGGVTGICGPSGSGKSTLLLLVAGLLRPQHGTLLLDEPLSSLDDRLKQQILPFLKRVKDETKIPMLYVSHSRAEVEFLADRVLSMDRGRLQQQA